MWSYAFFIPPLGGSADQFCFCALVPLGGEPAADPGNAFHTLDQPGSGLLGLGAEKEFQLARSVIIEENSEQFAASQDARITAIRTAQELLAEG